MARGTDRKRKGNPMMLRTFRRETKRKERKEEEEEESMVKGYYLLWLP
jgi:hypothetical protein